MCGTFRSKLLATLACILLIGIGSGPNLAEAAPWQAAKVSGQAWVTTAGTQRALGAGATLDMDATVVTAERSRVMLVRGTETIVVGPVSVMAIAEHPDQTLSTTVLQKGGTVNFDVEKRNVQHFSVETPMLAAVVKGTHFTVVVGRVDSTVSVDRGNVQVTALATGQTGSISVGQRAKVNPGGLSVSGGGRRAAVTQTAPRQAVVAALSEVTPTSVVSVGEMAAARAVAGPATGQPARTGLFSAIASAFSHMGQQGSSSGGLVGTAAANDQGAHTSATGGFSAAASSQPGGSTAVSSSAVSSSGLSSSSGGIAGNATSSNTGASNTGAAGSGLSSGHSDNGRGTTGSSGNGGANNGSSGSSSGSSDNGRGNSGMSGNGGADNGSAGSSSGKSDNGKGNGGTPGNGGANNGSAGSSSGKSDNGKGNGGTPGNGGANRGSSKGSK